MVKYKHHYQPLTNFLSLEKCQKQTLTFCVRICFPTRKKYVYFRIVIAIYSYDLTLTLIST